MGSQKIVGKQKAGGNDLGHLVCDGASLSVCHAHDTLIILRYHVQDNT